MTELAPSKWTPALRIKGEPYRYVAGHTFRQAPAPCVEEDRGFATRCWIWQWGLDSKGYGNSKGRGAHRVYYEKQYGPLRPELELDHLCRVRRCVNPEHLEAVTHAENARRGNVAVLNPEKVRLIRELHRSGHTQNQLMAMFGVSQGCISGVLTGRTWKNIS